jgi:hypothetical protein
VLVEAVEHPTLLQMQVLEQTAFSILLQVLVVALVLLEVPMSAEMVATVVLVVVVVTSTLHLV